MLNRLVCTLSIMAIVSLGNVSNADALLIDSFQTGLSASDSSTPGSDVERTTSGDMLGGVRKFVATANAGVLNMDSNLFSLGIASIDQPASSNGVGRIIYDSQDDADLTVDSTGQFAMPQDLTESGNIIDISLTGFALIFPSSGSYSITINLYEHGGTGVSSLTKIFTSATTSDQTFFFSDFSDPSIAGDVGAIELVFDGSSAPGADLTFNFVETGVVPEPTSIALLGMGAFGLMGYGWRRKKKVVVE